MSRPGTLFVVPVPLGDLGDLSPRARAVLGAVQCIAAEDTRVTARLLREAGVTTSARLVSHHDHNEQRRATQLVQRLLGGDDVALVSDAGTPLISDPGYRLVGEAIAADVRVVPLPGPCAAVTALSAAGLPTDRFVFLGFLPRDAGPRRSALAERRWERATVVLYEAPHRVCDLLEDVLEVWGERPVVVARSLTKEWEELIRGSASEVLATLRAEERVLGELTIVIGGDDGASGAEHDAAVGALIEGLVDAGVAVGVVRDVVSAVFGRSRRDVYQAALAARNRAG